MINVEVELQPAMSAVKVMVPVRGEELLFVAVNDGITDPVPPEPNPILVLLLDQE